MFHTGRSDAVPVEGITVMSYHDVYRPISRCRSLFSCREKTLIILQQSNNIVMARITRIVI
ncbi:hypothetical protein Plhal304r1_c033g0105191 [Plasmopara halstedii]